jgi:GDP-L-fucose synthase
MEKILILGGTGFIGKSLKELFLEDREQYKIFFPTRKELNITKYEECYTYLKKVKPNIIIHASVDINSVENSVGMLNNILANKKFFGKLIYLGSGGEYNPRIYKPLMKENFTENSYPENGYYLSKFICGREIEFAEIKNIFNLRIFGIYGPYELYQKRFISNNICRVLSGLPISMNRDMKFDYLYINDLFKIIKIFINKDSFNYKTYNVCSGKPIKLSYLANQIKKIMGVKKKIIIKNKGLNPEYSGNPNRLLKEIGNYSFIKHSDSIKEMVNFFYKKFSINNDYLIKED